MQKEEKQLWAILLVLAVLVFVWIGAAVGLTESRDMSDFTDRDWGIFWAMVVLEVLTFAGLFAMASKLGSIRKAQGKTPDIPKNAVKIDWLGVGVFLAALVVATGMLVLGRVCGPLIPESWRKGVYIAGIIGIFVPFCLMFWSSGMLKKLEKDMRTRPVVDTQQELLKHRENSEAAAVEKLRELRRLRGEINTIAVVLGISGCISAFGLGAMGASGSLALVSLAGLLPAFSQIPIPRKQQKMDEAHDYLPRENFPELYALAEKARDTLGCKGKVGIILTENCNAGIYYERKRNTVALGAVLLNVVGLEELYACLLHEYGHVADISPDAAWLRTYAPRVLDDRITYFGSTLTDRAFFYPLARFQWAYNVYNFAVSVNVEQRADRAAEKYGDRAAFASLLLKLKYSSLFRWEQCDVDSENLFAWEQPDADFLRKETEKFRNAIAQRQDDWNELARAEIISRNASHPTTKMRLEALQIDHYAVLPTEPQGSFGAECEKALEWQQKRALEKLMPEYGVFRQKNYLEPLKTVEDWEQSGKPLEAEKYSAVATDLRILGRRREAEDLCRRAMEELSPAAGCYGKFCVGSSLLYRYDASGVQLLYEAAEENHNYLESGANTIGDFLCMTGRAEELAAYRAWTLKMAQKDQDEYSYVNDLTKEDRLTTEHLPPELLEGLLERIRENDDGAIRAVYLVRKEISETFFTSAVVLRFTREATADRKAEIMERIFQYLDTCGEWQFSLFDYDHVRQARPDTVPDSLIYSKS